MPINTNARSMEVSFKAKINFESNNHEKNVNQDDSPDTGK